MNDLVTRCPVSATIALIGGKDKPLILWHLSDKTLRFSDLKTVVEGATSKMLTQQLRELESDGLVHRHVYPVVPQKLNTPSHPSAKAFFPS